MTECECIGQRVRSVTMGEESTALTVGGTASGIHSKTANRLITLLVTADMLTLQAAVTARLKEFDKCRVQLPVVYHHSICSDSPDAYPSGEKKV